MPNKIPAKYVVIYDNFRDNYQECTYVRGFPPIGLTPEQELKDKISLLRRCLHTNIRVWKKCENGGEDTLIELSEIK